MTPRPRKPWKACRALAGLAGICVVLLLLPSGSAQQYSEWSAPVNMGAPINTPSFDSMPALSKDGLSLYFSSNRPTIGAGGNHDLFVSQRVDRDAPWGEPVNPGANVNHSTAIDTAPAFSRDGHWLFFNSTRPGYGGHDLYVCWRQHTNDDLGWEPPMNLGSVINTASNDGGSTYFEGDGSSPAEFYFGSDRPGGLGGYDIYVSRVGEDGTLGPPTLVTELSSPLGDSKPQITGNGLEIILQSSRAGSVGYADLWIARRPSLDAPWGTPANISEVNTAANEMQHGLSTDGLTLIFTSDRPGGLGGADLYISTRTKGKGRGR